MSTPSHQQVNFGSSMLPSMSTSSSSSSTTTSSSSISKPKSFLHLTRIPPTPAAPARTSSRAVEATLLLRKLERDALLRAAASPPPPPPGESDSGSCSSCSSASTCETFRSTRTSVHQRSSSRDSEGNMTSSILPPSASADIFLKRQSYLARVDATARSQARIARILNGSSSSSNGASGGSKAVGGERERELPPLPRSSLELQDHNDNEGDAFEREVLGFSSSDSDSSSASDDDEDGWDVRHRKGAPARVRVQSENGLVEKKEQQQRQQRQQNTWAPTYSTFGFASTGNLGSLNVSHPFSRHHKNKNKNKDHREHSQQSHHQQHPLQTWAATAQSTNASAASFYASAAESEYSSTGSQLSLLLEDKLIKGGSYPSSKAHVQQQQQQQQQQMDNTVAPSPNLENLLNAFPSPTYKTAALPNLDTISHSATIPSAHQHDDDDDMEQGLVEEVHSSSDDEDADEREQEREIVPRPQSRLRMYDDPNPDTDDLEDDEQQRPGTRSPTPIKGLKRLTLTSVLNLESKGQGHVGSASTTPANSPWRMNKPLPSIESHLHPTSTSLARRNSLPATLSTSSCCADASASSSGHGGDGSVYRPTRNSMQVMMNASYAVSQARQLQNVRTASPSRPQSRLSMLQYRRSSITDDSATAVAARNRAHAMAKAAVPASQRYRADGNPQAGSQHARARTASLSSVHQSRDGPAGGSAGADGDQGEEPMSITTVEEKLAAAIAKQRHMMNHRPGSAPTSGPLGMMHGGARASMPDMFDWRLREEIGRQAELLEQHKAEIQRLTEAVKRLTRETKESPRLHNSKSSPCLTTGSGEREWIAEDQSTRSRSTTADSTQSFQSARNAAGVPERYHMDESELPSRERPDSAMSHASYLFDEEDLQRELERRARSCDKLARLTGEAVLASASVAYGIHGRSTSTYSTDPYAGLPPIARPERKSIHSWLNALRVGGSSGGSVASPTAVQGSSELEHCFPDIRGGNISRASSRIKSVRGGPSRLSTHSAFEEDSETEGRTFFGVKLKALGKGRKARTSEAQVPAVHTPYPPVNPGEFRSPTFRHAPLTELPEHDYVDFYGNKARSVPNLLASEEQAIASMNALGLQPVLPPGAVEAVARLNRSDGAAALSPSTSSSFLTMTRSSSMSASSRSDRHHRRTSSSLTSNSSTTATSPPTSPMGPKINGTSGAPPSSYFTAMARASPIKSKTALPPLPQAHSFIVHTNPGGSIFEAPSRRVGSDGRNNLTFLGRNRR